MDFSTELKRETGHRKEIEIWRFERLPFFRANKRNQIQLWIVYGKNMAT